MYFYLKEYYCAKLCIPYVLSFFDKQQNAGFATDDVIAFSIRNCIGYYFVVYRFNVYICK